MMKSITEISRRKFIELSATGAASLLTLSSCTGRLQNNARIRPSIFVTPSNHNGLRSLESVQNSILSGHSKLLWDGILEKAELDSASEPLLPSSMVPHRESRQADLNNLDFYIVDAAGKRITRNALAYLITGEDKFKDVSFAQIKSVIDDWPDWIDQSHIRFGHPAGLRTGMLAYDTSLAFDWLYNGLSEADRQFIVDGLDRKAIQPFLTSISQDPWWMHDLNNWLTTICGGLGVCGVALHERHPDSQQLIQITDDAMDLYLTQYGAQGEFNENPSYANATVRPVEYYMARRYTSAGTNDRISTAPFPDTCYWLKYFTLPSGYTASFGDSHTDSKPWTKYVAAVAAATSDATLQQFYLDNNRGETGDPVELLWYDDELTGKQNEDLPTGRAYPAFGGCVSSRSSWDDDECECTVYGKASREDNHEHHDAGTVCIDGFKERLIVDPGSPSGYPADFFETDRWKYYNAGIVGHNILMFDSQELKVPNWTRGDGPKENLADITGRFIDHSFDSKNGGWWKMDLSEAYRNGEHVERTVIHLHPGYIAVLDKATLPKSADISLRWHTIDKAAPTSNGHFVVQGVTCGLTCMVADLEASPSLFSRREHAYQEPFNKDRSDQLLVQRNESYVEVSKQGGSCTYLSLFALTTGDANPATWAQNGRSFTLGSVECTVADAELRLEDSATGRSLIVSLA